MYGRKLGILIALLFAVSAQSATLAVNGAAGCSDTAGNPYCTINKAILAASSGDTIQIASGTYAGTIANFSKALSFTGAGSGTNGTVITKSMTYTGTGPLSFSNVRIQGGGSNLKVSGTGNFAGLTLSDAAFIGNGSGAHGVFIKQNGSVSNVSVTNCTFDNHGQSGFLIQKGTGPVTNVDNVTVTGSTFAGNGEYGLRSDPRTTNLHVTNSNITNNAIDGFLLLNADGVTLDTVTITGNRNGILLIPLATTDAISNVTLTNVTASNNTRFISGQYGSGMTLSASAGSISQISAINSTFSANTIHGVATSGAVSQVSIDCSIIESNGQHGIHDASSPSAEVTAEHVYWGCPTGPNTTGCSAVSGNVDYLPYRNSASATCNSPVLTSITVTPASATLEPSQTAQFTATATYSDASTANVTSTAAWSSSVTAVATVSASGLVTAAAGGTTTITASIGAVSGSAAMTVEAAGEPLPPDPAMIAPPIDPTKITTVYESTRFLYEGTPRIQTGVAADTIERVRAAVIRGRVLQRGGAPLSGVRITILGHPEYGQTLTRSDGRFDLAVNGGGDLTVQYRRNGLIDLDRTAVTRWNDWSTVEDVVMIPYDAAMTVIDLAAPGVKVHRGTTSSDVDGFRAATLLFAPGTTATMTLADGSTQPLTTLGVRATEYTVGDDGPRAMPATLPPQSAYTYCVELSADEAIAAGATQVDFSKPVALYLEDFLSFGAGAEVPVGHYSAANACWVPNESGRVVTIAAIVEGRAYLDTDGDGAEDDSDTEIGTTIAEREKLATIYTVGATLWRASTSHFSPLDLNLPPWAPYLSDPSSCPTTICDFFNWENEIESKDVDDGPSPKLDPKNEKATPKSCKFSGSVIECEGQVLGEEIGIVGVGSLSYRTSRVPGRGTDRSVTIPLSNGSVPVTLQRIDLIISCAGQETELSFPPQPNLSYRFTWDGKDAYGRTVQGKERVNAEVRYVYNGVYTVTRVTRQLIRPSLRFGLIPPLLDTIDRSIVRKTRFEVTRDQTLDIKKRLGSWDARGVGLGGWTLAGHHVYDHSTRALQDGSGDRLDLESTVPIIRLVAGTGSAQSSGDGQPARKAGVLAPRTTAVGPDGSVYIGEPGRIRKIDRKTGVITTFAGNGNTTYNGANNVPPLQASFSPTDIAVGSDGSILIADETNRRLFRIRNGLFTVVAGNGQSGSVSEGETALSQPIAPHGVAAVGDCIAYIADRFANKIWRVMCDGRVYTVAGSGQYIDPLHENAPRDGVAGEVPLSRPAYVGVDAGGQVYFTAEGNAIYRIDPNGFFSRLTTPEGIESEADPYAEPTTTPVGAGGLAVFGTTIFHAFPSRHQVDRLIVGVTGGTIVGSTQGDGGAEGPAAQATLSGPQDVAYGHGRLYIADTENDRVRVVEGLLPATLENEVKLPSSDGSELYVFDKDGKHLRTVDALTGVTSRTFSYSAGGLLQSITDLDANVTMIERAANGQPQAIVAPGGQRTTLQLDANGFISQIGNPAGDVHHFTYDSKGLLRVMRDPRLQAYHFDYDAEGRLIQDRDPASGSTTLTRDGEVDNYTITRTTAEGRTATHSVFEGKDGARQSVITGFDGTQSVSSTDALAASTSTTPHGSRTGTQSPDPRFGFFAPVGASSYTTPLGRRLDVSESRSVVLSNPDDPFSPITSASAALTINGRVSSSFFDAATRTITQTSPSGRTSVSTIDAKGWLVQTATPGIAPIVYSYDSRGLLDTVTQHDRTITYSYDSRQRVESATDPLGRTVRFFYDNADRVIRQRLPDNREIAFDYDVAGNLIGLTPAGRSPHVFSMTPVNLEQTYTPPSVPNGGATEHVYNRDRELTTILNPGGTSIGLDYDGAARLRELTIARGAYSFGYNLTGNVASITAPDGTSLNYDYDGSLPLSMSSATGTVSWNYDSDLAVSSENICDAQGGCSASAFEYDDDKLLTRSGQTTLIRDPDNGRLAGSSVGSVHDAWTYNTVGETLTYESRFDEDTVLFREEYIRDAVGRISAKQVSVGANTSVFEYLYDLSGRLIVVKQDGAIAASYEYDSNGNRLSRTTTAGTDLSSCDGQDRMVSYGGTTYAYSPTGDLESATNTSGTTNYSYDELGNLIEARLADGRVVEYEIDAQNRRVGRKVNGAVTNRWLYSDQLRIVAELNANGAIVSRFVYGSRANVPDYMERDGERYRITSDHLGSPRLVVDTGTGAIVQRIDYDEYGVVLSDSNPGFQPFGFANGLHDPDTGLVRFGARDYDPRTGRWTAKDPIGFAGGDSNLYGYVGNDPVNVIDPSGLEWVAIVFGPNGVARHEAIVDVAANGVPGRVYENAAGLPTARQNVPWAKSFAARHPDWTPLWAKRLGRSFDPTKHSYDSSLDSLFEDNTYQCTNYSEWKQKGQPPASFLRSGPEWLKALYGRPVLADRDPSASWFSTMGYNQGYKPATDVIGNWNP